MKSFYQKNKQEILLGLTALGSTAVHPMVGGLVVGSIGLMLAMSVRDTLWGKSREDIDNKQIHRSLVFSILSLAISIPLLQIARPTAKEKKAETVEQQTQLARQAVLDGAPLPAPMETSFEDGRGYFWQKEMVPFKLAFENPKKDGNVVTLTVREDDKDPVRTTAWFDPETKRWLALKP